MGRLPLAFALAALAALFGRTLLQLAHQWTWDRDAGHGLLLAPLALVLAWRAGAASGAPPSRALGAALLVTAVACRYAGTIAAEPFSQRLGMLLAAAGLVAWGLGGATLRRWWLPATLLLLSLPLPQLVLTHLSFPLQLQASAAGAALLQVAGIPAHVAGNVIRLPGHDLFVTEACSGLRSLTALVAMGVLLGVLLLRRTASRVALVGLAVAAAIGMNAVRVFVTGAIVHWGSPAAADGFLHLSEGWLLFAASLALLAAFALAAGRLEARAAGVAHA